MRINMAKYELLSNKREYCFNNKSQAIINKENKRFNFTNHCAVF